MIFTLTLIFYKANIIFLLQIYLITTGFRTSKKVVMSIYKIANIFIIQFNFFKLLRISNVVSIFFVEAKKGKCNKGERERKRVCMDSTLDFKHMI